MAGDALIRPTAEPSRRDWIAVMSAMLGAFMAVLDIQITNSSLKDIQGALSATLEEGSWISTSYLVAEIIMIPLTAWLVQLLSARRLAVWVSVGFLIASLLCSLAWSLESMIVFRALQGFTGGALIPLAFTMTLIKLPEHHRAKGMALFAITATFAPSIGPTLGGWLTENWGWEYIFYINVPPGLIMIAGLLYGLEKKAPHWELLKTTDYAGIVTLGLGLGCLQVFLEEGHRKDWLESQLIVGLGSVALVSLILFVILQLSRPNPLINLGVLRERNFGLASISSLGLGVGLYGSIYVLPLYLAQIQGYNAMQIGEVIMWMGVPQLFLIPLVPKLMKVISPKWLCALGFALFGAASFFSGVLNPDFAGPQFQHIQIIRALGQPLVMVTVSLIATAYILPQDAGSASSLFNILRNLGGAIGIALLATLLDARAKVYFDYLRESIVLPLYLAQIQGYNAMQIGEVIMWMGVPQLFLIPLVPKLMKVISPKWLCALGFALFGAASFFSGVLNLDFAGEQFQHIQIVRALGQPLVMVTVSLIATAYILPQDAGSASSLFNILRNLGGAIGIALLATLLDARAKVYFDYLRESIVPTNPQVEERLHLLTQTLGSEQAALAKLSQIVHEQAIIMAYNDAFHFIGIALGVSMLAILLTRKLPQNMAGGGAAH
ncbi:MDR family MFS transporter [Pseudomonas sihuiensis]|uniref:Drug resistance transporter, EmrB/QacA subfamily n=1 Tax=Pseudomonas sihuiensis TaxID=1274359 RepID=A0A1H2L946_9PSED|nr:drug resistance transporter, EmrB/QacA subfamily [Pseudomonas sihuiensis]